MNKFMSIFFIMILVLLFNPTVTISFDTDQESSIDSSQKTALQREQEWMEAERKRLQQPEVKLERQLLDDMNRAMEKYYQSKDEPSRQKYESLYEQALALPKPSTKAYSACATAANLLGQPRQAIAILKKAIAEYPDERAYGTTVPFKVSTYYRIGSIAIRIGDPNEATRAYEAVINNSHDLETANFHKVRSLMLLADIAARLLDDKQLAAKRIKEMIETLDSIDAGQLQYRYNNMLKFLRGWALYEQERIETGTAPSRQKSDLSKEEYTLPFMRAMTRITINQQTIPEIEQAAQDDNSSVDSILARFGLAYIYTHIVNINVLKAEKYLLSIVKTDSYFKPYSEAMLDIVHELKDKQIKEIPILLRYLKQGDKKQRDSAALKLIREMGQEGIKVVHQAQQDPNKYVRYAAACNLAEWGRDPSFQPDFNVILEALTDNNPQIRREAGSSMRRLLSTQEIETKEIVAIIQLMNEHYSPELTQTIRQFLYFSRTNTDILSVAIPELATLLSHPNIDVRNGVLILFSRIRKYTAIAVPALVDRLDKEDPEMQRRIIGFLGSLGIDAEQAIPEIIKYLDHEDINLRKTAQDSLRQISPDKAEELIGKK